MADCTIIVQPTQTVSEAQRSRRSVALVAIYRLILECAGTIQNQTAEERTSEDAKTTIKLKREAEHQ